MSENEKKPAGKTHPNILAMSRCVRILEGLRTNEDRAAVVAYLELHVRAMDAQPANAQLQQGLSAVRQGFNPGPFLGRQAPS